MDGINRKDMKKHITSIVVLVALGAIILLLMAVLVAQCITAHYTRVAAAATFLIWQQGHQYG